MDDRHVPSGPFTTTTAAAAGWTAAAQRHAVASDQWERLRPGVFDVAQAPSPTRYLDARRKTLRTAQAAALACDRTVLSHAPAAISADLPVVGRALDQPCLTVQSGTPLRDLTQVHLHRATLDEIVQINGYACTTVARTVVDLAREHGIDVGVVAADAALHHRLTTLDELTRVLRAQQGWPGIKTAREAIAFADALSESPLESLSRLRIARRGLPAPTLQRLICDELGTVIARADFYWDEYGVMGESDGLMKYLDDPAGSHAAQDDHTYELEALGLGVVRWGWRHLPIFDGVARRLSLSFARGARPGSPQRRWHVRAA